MLRQRFNAPIAVTALVAGFFAGWQEETPSLDPQVAEMKSLVTALEERVAFLEAFAEGQADAGEKLATALTNSEKKGFTAGINPQSREILLKGLRAQAEAMQSGKNKGKEEEAGAKTPRPRGDRLRRNTPR